MKKDLTVLMPRRRFLRKTVESTLIITGVSLINKGCGTLQESCSSSKKNKPFFSTRGVLIRPSDIKKWNWPQKAKQANLTTIGTHFGPNEVATFIKTEEGQAFLEECRKLGLEVEHELHAIGELLPRELFKKDPNMFRMNEQGHRIADSNLCVHSKNAVEIACENAVKYAEILRSTTGRYFYWTDDGQPMCYCSQCRAFSESDQALILENHMLQALDRFDSRATLAHLAYARTSSPPKAVKPKRGIFLEWAAWKRHFDVPIDHKGCNEQLLDNLCANLEVFSPKNAQVLDYWLDESLFARRKEPRNLVKIPWHRDVFSHDVEVYGGLGIRHITTFAVRVNGDYVKLFGEPPLMEYGTDLLNCRSGI